MIEQTTENVLEQYQKREHKFKKEVDLLNSRIRRSSLLRLSIFAATVGIAYFFFPIIEIYVPSLIVGFVVFIFLVLRHESLKRQRDLKKEILLLNQIEIEVQNRDYSNLPTGIEFKDPTHYFSHDIDLFGIGSFFQFLNRTGTKSGKELLANWMTSNDETEILEKQEAVQEMSSQMDWRQEYTATAKLINTELDHKTILDWIRNYQPFLPRSIRKLPVFFSLTSLLLIVSVSLGWIPFAIVTVWFFLGHGISLIYLKKINGLYSNADKAKSTFKQYHSLLAMIEKETFSSSLLKKEKQELQTQGKSPSEVLKEFWRALDALDQRNNLVFGILGNGFLLWDIHQSLKIESWIKLHHIKTESWFRAIAYFDAINSLSNYAFNYPKQVFPERQNSTGIIQATNLGHPLISPASRIDNDFSIKNGEFVIVTGANMAGKSTFLRTISLSIVMANLGLPVCADKFIYSPIKLITSMRTADSLADDSSYFYAEIKRLEFIVTEIKKDHYFIVLDEILKGTNSRDKAEGSKKFIRKLADSGSTGLIATHDLSLCEIEKEYPQISNSHFNVEITKDELHFDYLLKEGVCHNMNASFLLRKLKII